MFCVLMAKALLYQVGSYIKVSLSDRDASIKTNLKVGCALKKAGLCQLW